jgi:hypothetical protein
VCFRNWPDRHRRERRKSGDTFDGHGACARGLIVATRNRVDFEKAGVKIVDPFVEE